jgi:hypothetical protein
LTRSSSPSGLFSLIPPATTCIVAGICVVGVPGGRIFRFITRKGVEK